MQSDISEPAFKAWLLKNAYEVVGNRSDPQRCAYARFLLDQGYHRPLVGRVDYLFYNSPNPISSPSVKEKTPEWLSEFIRKFDTGGHTQAIGGSVTGAEALKYLEAA